MTRLRLAAAALNQTPLAWDDNRLNILAAIGAAREAEVGVLCLPELCISGYGCEDQFHSAGLHETSEEILKEIIPHCTSLAVSLGLGSFDVLDRLGEPRLGAGGLVGVNHVLGSGLIQLLGDHLKCRGARLDVARVHGRADLANAGPDVRLDRTIVEALGLVLAKPFLGAGGTGHRDFFGKLEES